MSDSCIFELEDNVWDEFGASNDHIVPHPSNEYQEQFEIQGGSQKKPWREVIGIMNVANIATIYGIQGKEENDSPFLTKKDRMLEKGSWSDTPDGMLPASCDSDTAKEVTGAVSDDTRMSSHGSKNGSVDKIGNFCEEDPILGDKCAFVDNNLYCDPVNHISQTDNDLSFLDNDHEDKESSDPLYYGWPDIGNFEDVDRMFSSDSTFGLGSLSNEDELCWFSPANAVEGSEDVLKSGSKLNSLAGNQEASREKVAGPSTNDFSKNNLVTDDKINFKSTYADDSALNHLLFENGFDAQSRSKDDLMFNEQNNLHKKLLKHHNKPERKRKERYMENGGPFHHYVSQNEFADVKQLFGDSSQVFSSSGIQQRKQNIAPDSLSYMQTHIPYLHLDYSHPSDQISVCPTPSGIKSENNGHMSRSPKESSCASNQLQSVESSHGPSLEAPSVKTNEKREKPFHCQTTFIRSFQLGNLSNPNTFRNSLSVQKQVHQSELDIGHSEVEGVSIGVPAELDSLDAQESSCMSSVLDEISLEATSFRQLQQVMEKLDIRTKLCIRDSLYRLAKSAEQRHNCANSSGGIRVEKVARGALMAEETNKCAGFIDMETDTNPIDRSIAHLLFHRPSDPSIMHTKDALSLKSNAMIHGSIASAPVKGEKQLCCKDTGTDADKNFLLSDEKQ